MAAQRMPLGHKRRGEAAAANDPARRTVRGRYAWGMRQAKAAGNPQSMSKARGIGTPKFGSIGGLSRPGFHG